jgi:hypothetical protein
VIDEERTAALIKYEAAVSERDVAVQALTSVSAQPNIHIYFIHYYFRESRKTKYKLKRGGGGGGGGKVFL